VIGRLSGCVLLSVNVVSGQIHEGCTKISTVAAIRFLVRGECAKEVGLGFYVVAKLRMDATNLPEDETPVSLLSIG
jgi:hypothetical protein